jgi:hypothetical protein
MDDVNDDGLNIYINNKEDIIEDELITHLKEKRLDKKVSKSYLFYFKIS